ncbi:Protein transport protein sec20 [Coniochaeta hoffmannii]|uniref:Protein transport protein sec20 n=1 Tax=Coniochaeta hoffmannii TaxID=91930 RepID=A0AA38VTI5_9PEZI|nr:Protein transport protein sec20 [Coniochaeta hoffmannii]
MSFESLQDRLSALQETTSQLSSLITRLSSLKFQPGSVPLDSSPESNVAAELSSEISQVLREEEEDLELLREEITDLRPGRPGSEAEHVRARLQDGARRLEADLKHARVAFRKAQIAARQNLEAAQKLERSLLLASYSAAAAAVTSSPSSAPSSGRTSPAPSPQHTSLFPPGYRPSGGKRGPGKQAADERESLVEASSSVTSALRRTHALIASELSRSQFARETLAESTAALEALHHSYAGLDDMLRSSRDLLGTLLTSNKSDTWYLETAFWMLVGTLAWLVFRRWVYGPAWWLVWLPIRTLWGTGRGAVGLLARGKGGGGAEVGDVRPETGRVGGFDEQGRVPVPTVRTGYEARTEGRGTGEDSMVEKVGRMVDEIELQVGGRGKDEGREFGEEERRQVENKSEDGAAPNTMKRMWEEDREAQLMEAAQEAQIRDEL